ncbi:MAG: FAD-binding protein [Adlercreutzia sp.]
MLVIMGGIDCDDDCRALDVGGNPVGGLYVAGNTQGGRFGAEYPMTAPGISHGIALSLGRLAGKNAATLD